MVNKAIEYVIEDINEWKGDKGTVWYVNGGFRDGDTFSIGSTTPDRAADHRTALMELIDQEIEYVLEGGQPRGGDKTGIKWRIAKGGYPGDPREQYGYSESARTPTPQNGSTPASGAPVPQNGGSRDDQIAKAVALKAAATVYGRIDRDIDFTEAQNDVLKFAERFRAWLTSDASDGPSIAEVTVGEGSGAGSSPAGTSPSSTSDWESDQGPTASEESLSLLRDVLGGQVIALKAARAAYGDHITRLAQLTEAQTNELMEAAESQPAL